MQNFLLETGLKVIEERCFRDRICRKLSMSEQAWWNRISGRTALSASERIIMEQELQQLRDEVASGVLDLRAYNNK